MKGSCDRVRASADTKPGQHRHTATPPHHRHKACCEGNESVHTGACGTSMCQHSGVTYHPTTPQRSIPPTPHRGVPSPAVGWTRLAAGCARPRQARASFPLRCAWRGGVASPASSHEEHGQPVSTVAQPNRSRWSARKQHAWRSARTWIRDKISRSCSDNVSSLSLSSPVPGLRNGRITSGSAAAGSTRSLESPEAMARCGKPPTPGGAQPRENPSQQCQKPLPHCAAGTATVLWALAA